MDKVLYNIDMLDPILKYLRFQQILKLRLVCYQLNSTIVHCPNFLERGKAILGVSPDLESFDILTLPLFKTVLLAKREEQLDEITKEDQENVAALLHGAKKLKLYLSNSQLLLEVRSLDHLRILHLSYGALENIDFQSLEIFGSQVFQRLQELGLRDCELEEREEIIPKVIENLVWLSSVCISLTSLSLESMHTNEDVGSNVEYSQSILRFLQLNCEHLTTLKIGEFALLQLPSLADIRMPLLKICAVFCIVFRPLFVPEDPIITFLGNHPFLTELSIETNHLESDIIDLFRHRGNCLKHLKIKCDSCSDPNIQSPNFWSFLKEYKILETFSLNISCYFVDPEITLGSDIAVHIPENSLKKICIRSPCAENYNDSTLYRTLLTKPYKQLTSLLFTGGPERTNQGAHTITDQDLQIIFQEMTYLLKLRLVDCRDITDSGIMGTCDSSTTQSNISNLQGFHLPIVTVLRSALAKYVWTGDSDLRKRKFQLSGRG